MYIGVIMEKAPLIGLVLAGGASSRMGTDKGLLNYHGMAQRYHLYHLLESCCEQVFISCTQTQAATVSSSYSMLIDEYENIGPMAALLSAFNKYPDYSFVLLACDYPFFNQQDLALLMEGRHSLHDAVCFYHPESKIPEALLGIYENSCKDLLFKEAAAGHYSLRYFLPQVAAKLLLPRSADSIRSVDSKEQYQLARQQLQKEKDANK